jgi:hypothetical protein
MKKILASVLFIFMAIGVSMAQDSKAEITFEKLTHDFGTIKEVDGPVSCTFKFKNTGTGMLVIYQAIASCGCTSPTFPKEPIKPGDSGEIKVTYNGAGKSPGKFDKVITLRTNTKDEIIRLKIQGTMIGK